MNTEHVVLAKNLTDDPIEPRKAYCQALIDIARANNKVCVLEADLMGAIGTGAFKKEFPDRTFDCGIQEANMVGVAAGLSSVGFIPFAHSFGPFIARRACDQVFMSCLYAKQNVKLVGSDPGISASLNGGTHMPFEDVGIMRSMPDITVVEPIDSIAVAETVKCAAASYGTWYIRFPRKKATKVYEEGTTFRPGVANLLKMGKDVTILAMGYCVSQALAASEELKKLNISARVIDMYSAKPLNEEAVIQAAEETGNIITAENHNVINGLGGAVADVIAQNKLRVGFGKVGVADSFGEVGSTDYLAKRFGLTSSDIVKATLKVLGK